MSRSILVASMNRCFLAAGCQRVQKAATMGILPELDSVGVPPRRFRRIADMSSTRSRNISSGETEVVYRLGQNTTTRPRPSPARPALPSVLRLFWLWDPQLRWARVDISKIQRRYAKIIGISVRQSMGQTRRSCVGSFSCAIDTFLPRKHQRILVAGTG